MSVIFGGLSALQLIISELTKMPVSQSVYKSISKGSDIKEESYQQIMEGIRKKIGKERPMKPADLPVGNWSEQAIRVLEERYLDKDAQGKIIESPDELIWRVAWAVSSAEVVWGADMEGVMETARRFYEILVNKQFLPNSPTLMNAGKENGLQYSGCFVLPVDDSIEGIFESLKHQAIIHQSGGGTGFSFSRLRQKGSQVKKSRGVASGPVSFMKIYNEATQQIKQGGTRRGANMGILRVDHPDIREFIICKLEGGITNFNISVAVTDNFMNPIRTIQLPKIENNFRWIPQSCGMDPPGMYRDPTTKSAPASIFFRNFGISFGSWE